MPFAALSASGGASTTLVHRAASDFAGASLTSLTLTDGPSTAAINGTDGESFGGTGDSDSDANDGGGRLRIVADTISVAGSLLSNGVDRGTTGCLSAAPS